MPIIVGAPRSGTTLLRLMLDAHPDMAIPPETGFLALAPALDGAGPEARQRFFEAVTSYPPDAPAWNDFGLDKRGFRLRLDRLDPFSVADGFREFYRSYAERFGKPRWGDKTPMLCHHLRAIEPVLPEAHFLHIIRDGRDVALSWRQWWFAPGRDMPTLAARWRECVLAGREQGRAVRHYLEVSYEQLVRDPETVLRKVCAFVDLDYSTALLEFHRNAAARLEEHRERRRPDGTLVVSHQDRLRQQERTLHPVDASRLQQWKLVMSREERAAFESVAGEVLREFGYGGAD
jgi:hypothetical protein